MKTDKISVLFLITAVVLPFLLAACFSEWTGQETGELAAATISIAASDTSRQLVTTTSGTTSETHTYKLKIDNGGFTDFTPGSTFSVVTGSHTFEIRAYGNPDTIWTEPNNPHPFPSETPVLRAIGKTSGTVTQSGPNSFSITLDSATEVTNWAELEWAVLDPESLYSAGRKEAIILKPGTWNATSTITIDREIELRAEGGAVTIIRDSNFEDEFFNITGADSTIGTFAGKLAIGRTLPLSETDKGANVGSSIILDGGSTDDPATSLTAQAPLIIAAGDCTIGSSVILRNNKNMNVGSGVTSQRPPLPGGVLVTGGTFTLWGAITGNEEASNSGRRGGGVFMSGGSFVMEDGALIGSNTSSDSGGGVSMTGGSFVMEKGALIGGNTAGCYGGGVYIENLNSSSSFTMNGGTIGGEKSPNTAIDGAGVFIKQTDPGIIIFQMADGSISYNIATHYSGGGSGGGVVLSGGTFKMTGGSITMNEANLRGGGVFIADGIFDISAATGLSYKEWVKDNLDSEIPPANVWIDSDNSGAVIIGGPGNNNGW